MNTGKLRTAVVAVVFCAATGAGLSACNKGTEPGDVNVERSEIVEEGSIIESDEKRNNENSAAEKYEHHYDHADHPDSTALGSGAYDQDGDRDKRP